MTDRIETTRACPVCNHRAGYVLGRLKYSLFDDLNLSGEKTLVQCGNCSMRFDDVSFSDAQLQQYYRCNEHYAASSFGGSGGTTPANAERYDRIIDELCLPPGAVIVDFGCGQGGFVAQCRARGFNGIGIEPSRKSRELGVANDLEIYASLEDFLLCVSPEKVQAVVLSHVLEHLLSPGALLGRLVSLFPRAVMYLEVPDASAYLPPAVVRWSELYFEHLSYFDARSLSALAHQSNIKTLRQGIVSFSSALPNTTCCYLTGTMKEDCGVKTQSETRSESQIFPLPPVPGSQLLHQAGDLALWGVSQFAMLLLGSHDFLSQVKHLFDSSPAKLGRSIGGIKIEHPDLIRDLSPNTRLILPTSPHISQMKRMLVEQLNFRGAVLEI